MVEAIELLRLATIYRCSVKYLVGQSLDVEEFPDDLVELADIAKTLTITERTELVSFARYMKWRQAAG